MNKEINPSDTKIGWIGTGVMGRSMCMHILKEGYETLIYNRTKDKADGLIEAGAKWVDNPKDLAKEADVIFTIVGFPKDVREVYLGENGIISGLDKGKITVDMTTTEPSLATKIYENAKDIGATSVDAPVSGGDIGAQQGTLSIMVGGEKDAVEHIMPLLNLMGKKCCLSGQTWLRSAHQNVQPDYGNRTYDRNVRNTFIRPQSGFKFRNHAKVCK